MLRVQSLILGPLVHLFLLDKGGSNLGGLAWWSFLDIVLAAAGEGSILHNPIEVDASRSGLSYVR